MSKKVLVADDSSVIQTLTKKILTTQDFEVKGLKSGVKVMETIEKDDYDVILMDINLPGVDGMTLINQIRGLKNNKSKTPIIIISGNYKNYSKEDFEKLDISIFLKKPLDYDALVDAVKAVAL